MHHQPPNQVLSLNWIKEKTGLLIALWILETLQLSSRGIKEMIPAAKKWLAAQLLRLRMLLQKMKDGIHVSQKMKRETQPSGSGYSLVSWMGLGVNINKSKLSHLRPKYICNIVSKVVSKIQDRTRVASAIFSGILFLLKHVTLSSE